MATAEHKAQRGDGTKVQWTGALCDFYDAFRSCGENDRALPISAGT